MRGHGGELAVAALAAALPAGGEGSRGLREVFTLSGGHIFPVLDACARRGVRIVDTRDEQTAAFGAEAVAKLTRRPGVAVVTAGPGVTNCLSPITSALRNGSPLVVVGGRAPQFRWGSGSLQELDHIPLLSPVTKLAATAPSTGDIAGLVARAVRLAASAHRGPVFVDIPLDVLYGEGEAPPEVLGGGGQAGRSETGGDLDHAAALLTAAERPAIVAGGDLWWGGAWEELRLLAETCRLPVFMNGMGRGLLPADHELAFARSRHMLAQADLVIVAGTPLDFRLSFGHFGPAGVVHLADSGETPAAHGDLAASAWGDLATLLGALCAAGPRARDHSSWLERLGEAEAAAAAGDEALMLSAATPIHPARVYGELRRRLDPDAVVIGDGGDFVSWAGRLLRSARPGCWLDPGPFGCLGTGAGYAAAARLVHPQRQVVLLAGDGAFGMSAMDVDTLVRHRLPVVIVVGNNGGWGLEKHPMRALYGYDVAADLQPACRYDEVVRALGGAGELVDRPEEIGPALDRAFAAGTPYLVNVLLDPEVAYPRSSNLA